MIVGLAGILAVMVFRPGSGVVALVLGLVALSQIKKSPDKYSGRGICAGGRHHRRNYDRFLRSFDLSGLWLSALS